MYLCRRGHCISDFVRGKHREGMGLCGRWSLRSFWYAPSLVIEDKILLNFFSGGFTVLSTKAISTLLTLRWIEIFTFWITYPLLTVSMPSSSVVLTNGRQVLLLTGVGQIRYLNRALMRFDSKVSCP